MTFVSQMTISGVSDVQRRLMALAQRMQPAQMRRPLGNFGAELLKTNRARLGRGVDVAGAALKSKRSSKHGLVPLGGARGTPARSIRWSVGSDGLDLFSTWIGAGVAFRGDLITPKLRKYLTIPVEARGGDEAAGTAGLSLADNRTGRRALHYKNTFFLRDDEGRLWLAQSDKRKKGPNANKLRFLFLLVRAMRYPKNEWLGASREDITWWFGVLGRHLDTFGGTL